MAANRCMIIQLCSQTGNHKEEQKRQRKYTIKKVNAHVQVFKSSHKQSTKASVRRKKRRQKNISIHYVAGMSEKLRRIFSKHNILVHFKSWLHFQTESTSSLGTKHPSTRSVVWYMQSSLENIVEPSALEKQSIAIQDDSATLELIRLGFSNLSTSQGQRAITWTQKCAHLDREDRLVWERSGRSNLCWTWKANLEQTRWPKVPNF